MSVKYVPPWRLPGKKMMTSSANYILQQWKSKSYLNELHVDSLDAASGPLGSFSVEWWMSPFFCSSFSPATLDEGTSWSVRILLLHTNGRVGMTVLWCWLTCHRLLVTLTCSPLHQVLGSPQRASLRSSWKTQSLPDLPTSTWSPGRTRLRHRWAGKKKKRERVV